MRTERGAGGIVARYIGFVGVVLLAAVPVYVYVEPPWRAPVTRLAAALVVGVALLELRAALARRVSRGSALDDARRRHAPESGVPARLLDLMDDVRAAVRSRRYFEGILWPRLATLARDLPERPPSRSLRRGPSLKKLGDVIAAIERDTAGGAAGRRGAGAPPSEATIREQAGAAGRRGAGAPPSEATIR